MKTNHNRNFKEKNRNYGGSPPGFTQTAHPSLGVSFGANWGGDNSNGHRGYAKAKRGAKKFVRSRIRFHAKIAVQRLSNEGIKNEQE